MSALSAPLQRAGLDAMKAGRLQEAIQYLTQAKNVEPDAPETYTYLGVAYTQLGDWDGANHAFGHVVELEPNSPKARFNLGKVFQMEGQTDGARFCFKKALELDPSYAQAREALDGLPSPTSAAAAEEPHSLTAAEVGALSAPSVKHMHLHGAQATTTDRAEGVNFDDAGPEQGVYSPI
jgi:tetratricopeptide (TPR) repeat protein